MIFLDWKKDSWFSRNGSILVYDKLEHFFIGIIGSFILHFFFADWLLLLIGFIAAFLWEIKDGLLPYDEQGNIEGFSWKDLLAGIAGIVIGLLISGIF